MNNTTISKWFSLLLLMMVAGVSSALAQKLSIADFTIKAGETKEVAITLESEATIYGFSTDITLSEGLTLEGDASLVQEFQTIGQNSLTSGAERIIVYYAKKGGSIAAGEVVKLNVKASETFESGTITLAGTEFSIDLTGGLSDQSEDAVANVTLEFTVELEENQKFVWENGAEAGGTTVGTAPERVGYPQAGYTTISLNGKADYSTDYVTITLDEPLKAGDKIIVTAFRNKDVADKKSGFKAQFNTGGEVTSGDGFEFVNINEAVSGSEEYGTEPNTITVVVPEEAEGSTEIKLTRSQTGTNLFITKFVVEKAESVGISTITTAAQLGTVYNLKGQRVSTPKKGDLYIVNGKKFIQK